MNILIIAIDTLRAQQMSCYGYERRTTPAIDELASEGVLFEQMICSAIPTQPSFTTIYTGMHPMSHGIVANGGSAVLPRGVPLLPEILLKAGWTTCAVDNLAHSKPWFHKGYEFYIDPSLRRPLRLSVTCEQQNRRAVEFLNQCGSERFFLFVHYWDPHTPYFPPKRYRTMFYEGDEATATDPQNEALEPLWRHPLGQRWRDTWLKLPEGRITDPEYIRALYDGSVRYADDGVNALLSALDASGQAENTLVVLMGDHGECLGEHGIWYDHHGLFDENMRVPFILRAPGQLPSGVRINSAVQTIDAAPTILDAVGIEPHSSMDGQSLLSTIDPSLTQLPPYEEPERVIASECTWQAKWTLRKPDARLILARSIDFYGSPPRELYDRIHDPKETRNIADEQPERADAMEAELEEWIASETARLGRKIDPVIEQGRQKFAERWR